MLRVKLLEKPAIHYKGSWLEPPVGFRSALLYVLAYRSAWIAREELAFLFWPDVPEANARRNLRNLLVRIKNYDYTEGLEIERSRLRWQVDTDVKTFSKYISSNDYEEGFDTYSGELLQDFHLDNLIEFSEWLEFERAKLAKDYQHAALHYLTDLENQQAYLRAAEVVKTLRQLDPFDEMLLRRQLTNLQAGKQGRQALTEFDAFNNLLEKEFGAEPEPATLDLVEVIRQDTNLTEQETHLPQLVETRAKPLHNLPAQLTPFVGRQIEQQRISEQLADPACRLLTLIAPGGMGKTSLALAVAKAQPGSFKDGVCFVAFASVQSSEQMVFSLADALGLTLNVHSEARQQVIMYLANKNMLLVLDNLEHLVNGVGLVAELLEQAPHVKIVATSRERLNLRAEWLFDLGGLSVPENGQVAIEDYDAIKLLIQAGKRVQADFDLSENDRRAAIRICQLVAGMPLAIELALNWLRVLSLEEIALEIEKGIDLLEASTRDVPERHRSIRAVFDYSWNLLSKEEKQALGKLTVFTQGFDRKAATKISDIGLVALSQLVNKSFLTSQDGRYSIHPLVVQYIEAKELDGEEPEEIAEKHAWYYLRLLRENHSGLKTLKRKESLRMLEQDIGNIRRAWQWMLETLNLEAIKTFAFPFADFFENRSLEGEQLLSKALSYLDEGEKTHHGALGYILVALVDLDFGGIRDSSKDLAQKALGLFQPLNEPIGMIRCLYCVALWEWFSGNYQQARAYALEGIELSKKHNEPLDLAKLYLVLGFSERELSSFQKVSELYEGALEELRQLGDLTGLCQLLNQYGLYLIYNTAIQKGEPFLQEALNLSEDLNYRKHIPLIVDGLAESALRAKDYDRAKALGQQALIEAKNPETFHAYIQLRALTKLARVATARADYLAAETHLKHSLAQAWQEEKIFGTLANLGYFGEWYLAQERIEDAAYYLSYVDTHPALSNELRGDIEMFLEQVPPKALQNARASLKTQAPSLDTMVLPLLGSS